MRCILPLVVGLLVGSLCLHCSKRDSSNRWDIDHPSDTHLDSDTTTDTDLSDSQSESEQQETDDLETDTQLDSDTTISNDPQCENEAPEPVFCGDICKPVENNGPPSNRVSLILIGDGFTAQDLEKNYYDLAFELADYMFTNTNDSEPYVRYRRFINFYRIDLVSNESGVDQPGKNVWVDTPLDGEDGCTDWRIGMCQVNWEKTHNAIEQAMKDSDVPWTDWRLVTLNTKSHCGASHYPARGTLAVYCPYAPESPDIALHEGGHAFHWLADTYWTLDEAYTGSEPPAVNLTKNSTGAKWSHWLGYDDPILGKIGAYEGGGQYKRGLYRPSYNQKMGSAEYCHAPGPPYCPHDAVSREKIVLDIYNIVDPLDNWADNKAPLTNPETLWVDVVDCEVIKVDWYVDDALVASDFGEVFNLKAHNLQPGQHTIEARAYDDTEWVRQDRTALEQNVTWTVILD